MMRRRAPRFFSEENFRFIVVALVLFALFGVIIFRLFLLQVVENEKIQTELGGTRNITEEISARRGNIFTVDSKTGDRVPLALNTTLYKVFIDAREKITHPTYYDKTVSTLTDLIYTEKEFKKCRENSEKCPEGSVVEIKNEEGEVVYETLPSYQRAKDVFAENMRKKIAEPRTYIIYATQVPDLTLKQIQSRNIQNLNVSLENKSVGIYLENLSSENRIQISQILAQFFGGDPEKIAEKLYVSKKGYVPILSRVPLSIIEEIEKAKQESRKKYLSDLSLHFQLEKRGNQSKKPLPPFFQGVGFEPDPVRYYPEGDMGANIIGFLNANGKGQYGIEEKLDTLLSGEDGKIKANRDIHGNAITIEKNTSAQVVDGANVVLTIDRILQQKVENILDAKVEEFQADSGQIIVMNPSTGAILVMANSPRFNPNFFGDVYERQKIKEEDREFIYKTTPLEQKDREGNLSLLRFPDFEEKWELLTQPQFYMFSNKFGPGVYINKITSALYEPGSVIKPLIMAAAFEEQEIQPSTTYFESAPLEIGPFTIRNADKSYLGTQTMTNIMERSANIGMAFIAKRMGKHILYKFLKELEFGEYTNILLPDELSGSVKYHKKWSEALMYTSSFGQGFSATPLQVIKSWTPLSNGGFLVNPYIVESIEYSDGSKTKHKHSRKKVFSPKTVQIMEKILISSVENGVAKQARMRNHYIAGKTGTSQISKIDGVGYEDLEEIGSTITSFIGFAPVDSPEFLVLVKYDRPRKGVNGRAAFGSSTAAPTFKEVMQQLFWYYDVPKDKF